MRQVYPPLTLWSTLRRPDFFGDLYPPRMEEWTEEERKAFGRRLRDARERKGLTLVQVGAMVDKGKAGVGHWETGTNIPRADYVAKLAVELDVDPAWLLLGRKPADAQAVEPMTLSPKHPEWQLAMAFSRLPDELPGGVTKSQYFLQLISIVEMGLPLAPPHPAPDDEPPNQKAAAKPPPAAGRKTQRAPSRAKS